MERMKKRLAALLLCVAMVVTMLPILTVTATAKSHILDANQVSGSIYSSAYAAKLDSIFNGTAELLYNPSISLSLGSSLNNSQTYHIINDNGPSGKQCYIYAQAVYYYLFGDVPLHGSGYSGYWRNSRIAISNTLTVSYQQFKNAGVGFGAYIRTTPNTDGSYNGNAGHSMILLSYDSSSLTVLEGNQNGKGLICITVVTWDEFNSIFLTSKNRRISHIAQCIATATPINPPTKPVARTDKTIYLDDETVTIEWDEVANNSNYAINIYRNGTLTYEANLGNQNYYTISNAGVGTYVVYVSANNSSGSKGSDPYTFIVEELAKPDIPELEKTKSVYAPGESVTLTWSAAPRNEYYWINVFKDNVLIVNQGLDNIRSYTLSNMEVGNYVVYVSANNSAGTSGSAWCTFTVGQITVPGTPTAAGAKSTYFEGETVVVGWNKVDAAEAYYIEAYRDGQIVVGLNVGDTSTYSLSGLGEGSYLVKVWATNSVGTSEPSTWTFRVVKSTYYLNLYANINGQNKHDFSGCGMVDVYVNGMLAAYHVGNYYIEVPYGTTYEIKSITPLDGYSYDGLHFGTRYGTILENTDVAFTFRSTLPSLLETPKAGVFNGHTYYYFRTAVTWYDAKSICENMGGHLVTINSAEENQFMAGFADYSSLFWMGATDAATEGTWQWITGEPFTYANWGVNQPDNFDGNEGSENYLLNADSDGNWIDLCGCTPALFICEIDAAGYTISFDANGGNGIMSDLEADYGQSVVLPGSGYAKPGYAFSGWYVQRNSDGRWNTTDDKFTSDSELATGAVKKLYANGADVRFFNYDGSDGYTFVAVWEKDFIQGNVNGDGLADVTDMACLFDYLSVGRLSGAYQDDLAYFKAVADVNEDGAINILDYQALYELLRS